MPAFRDLTGQRFGRWTVLHWTKTKYAQHFWFCRCNCGTEKEVIGDSLKTGRSTSCGCYSKERTTRHGMEGTRIYNTWAQMLARCNNPKSTSYKNYGAKGVKVCDRWKDFVNFYADMGDKPDDMTLDRFPNSSGNYEPGNVRWATNKQQSRNRTNTIMLEYKGESKPMSEWAEIMGVKRKILENRIRQGWDVETALTKPNRKMKNAATLCES